jgi:hypothetical protein
MQILECDAKKLLTRFDIASPPGIVAATPAEAETAAMRLGAVFVKAIWSLVVLQGRWRHPESSGLLTSIAVVVVGFATRNAFDYMFAGSLATLFWILLAIGFSVQSQESEL